MYRCLESSPDCPSPTSWEWKEVNNMMAPVWSKLSKAAASLQGLIKCGCKKGCKKLCKCFKANLPCTELCACNGDCEKQCWV